MNQNEVPKDNLSISEVANQTTFLIEPRQKQNLGYDGLVEILLMGIVTVAGFRLIYLKSIRYLDRTHPLKPSIFRKLAQPSCKKCRFYNRYHFQCTVHPLMAKFSYAEYCPDYWQRDKRKFLSR